MQTVYRVGRNLVVSEKVMLAGFEAGWVESRMNNLDCGHLDSLGVLAQLQFSNGNWSNFNLIS